MLAPPLEFSSRGTPWRKWPRTSIVYEPFPKLIPTKNTSKLTKLLKKWKMTKKTSVEKQAKSYPGVLAKFKKKMKNSPSPKIATTHVIPTTPKRKVVLRKNSNIVSSKKLKPWTIMINNPKKAPKWIRRRKSGSKNPFWKNNEAKNSNDIGFWYKHKNDNWNFCWKEH